ncbi:MAG: hypothetical protein H6Q90_457 [Deltaproteobacteria bacterium]|nr:hypothetical protein [Deltaproteobacteria bacterium]
MAPILMATEADVDGKPGTELIALRTDGTLSIGAANTKIELVKYDSSVNEDWRDELRLKVVPLGSGRRGVLFSAPGDEPEDPPLRYRVFVVTGGSIRTVLDEALPTYGGDGLRFAPDGGATYTESGWTACTRAKHAAAVPLDKITFRLDGTGDRMVEVSRVPTAIRQKCDELAACPFVYVVDSTGTRRMGEILRNLRGASAATLQSLAVTAGTATTTIRIAEEKPEVTFLDEVYLEVDGLRIAPRSCSTAVPPAYCVADGRPYVMRQGDVLDLEFPGHGGAASLFARGYYIPTPTAGSRRRL